MINKYDNHSRPGYTSQYEAVLNELQERGLSSEILSGKPSNSENLDSNFLFPHEPSRETAIYDIITKYKKD